MTLLHEPHRLVYVLPCDLRVVKYSADDSSEVEMLRIDRAVARETPDRLPLARDAVNARWSAKR